MPEVLLKFKRIVGVGRLKGPKVEEGKQDLFWWEATSRSDIARVVALIGPWLCPAKRIEFERTLRVPVPSMTWPGSMNEELAWAGGFFDGEGCTYLENHRTHLGYKVPRLYVPQSCETGIAPELLRLGAALNGLGRISGVRRAKDHHKPYRRWRIQASDDVQRALHLLWPFIGDVKRRQAQFVMRVINAQLDLPRGNPAFGVAGTRFCRRGHDKLTSRLRPFRGRGKHDQDPNRHIRQCLECVRIDARARRQRQEKIGGITPPMPVTSRASTC